MIFYFSRNSKIRVSEAVLCGFKRLILATEGTEKKNISTTDLTDLWLNADYTDDADFLTGLTYHEKHETHEKENC